MLDIVMAYYLMKQAEQKKKREDKRRTLIPPLQADPKRQGLTPVKGGDMGAILFKDHLRDRLSGDSVDAILST